MLLSYSSALFPEWEVNDNLFPCCRAAFPHPCQSLSSFYQLFLGYFVIFQKDGLELHGTSKMQWSNGFMLLSMEDTGIFHRWGLIFRSKFTWWYVCNPFLFTHYPSICCSTFWRGLFFLVSNNVDNKSKTQLSGSGPSRVHLIVCADIS